MALVARESGSLAAGAGLPSRPRRVQAGLRFFGREGRVLAPDKRQETDGVLEETTAATWTFTSRTTGENFTLSGGALAGAGTLNIPSGGAAWTGGDMRDAGRTVVSAA